MSLVSKFFRSVNFKWKKSHLLVKVFLILCISIFLGLGAYFTTSRILSKSESTTSESELDRTVVLNPPTPLPPKYSVVNGVEIDRDEYDEVMSRKPIAIIVNNHKDARPQSGLSFADTVLEVLAEGGITRYVALFHNNYDVSKVGPIRSLRYYMIEFASGYDDALILHHGWAGFDGAEFERYNEKTDARGAVSKLGIKSIQTETSTYRDMQKAKTAGYVHSLYSDFTRINTEVDRLSKLNNWKLGATELESLQFKEDKSLENRGDFSSVDIKFMSLGGSDYNARFTYDKTNNNYPRFIGGVPDIDELTQKQITPKNVVIEWHNYADGNDGHSRIVIDMIGEDKVTILRDGDVVEGVWKKDCRLCRTKYFDMEGKEIELNRGQIWIVSVVKVRDRLISTVTIN